MLQHLPKTMTTPVCLPSLSNTHTQTQPLQLSLWLPHQNKNTSRIYFLIYSFLQRNISFYLMDSKNALSPKNSLFYVSIRVAMDSKTIWWTVDISQEYISRMRQQSLAVHYIHTQRLIIHSFIHRCNSWWEKTHTDAANSNLTFQSRIYEAV